MVVRHHSSLVAITNRLINAARTKRGIPPVKYSPKIYHFAKEHTHNMVKIGSLFHSHRYALQGGENCWMGKGIRNRGKLPYMIVRSWMNSKQGHREWLLSSKVKYASVAIVKAKGNTYFASWSFCSEEHHKATGNSIGCTLPIISIICILFLLIIVIFLIL